MSQTQKKKNAGFIPTFGGQDGENDTDTELPDLEEIRDFKPAEKKMGQICCCAVKGCMIGPFVATEEG